MRVLDKNEVRNFPTPGIEAVISPPLALFSQTIECHGFTLPNPDHASSSLRLGTVHRRSAEEGGLEIVSTFAEKLQTARYISSNAGQLWAKRLLRNLSSKKTVALVRELERNGMPVELDLEIPSWRSQQIIMRTTTIEPESVITISATSPLNSEAHGWRPYRARELQGVTLDVDSGLAFVSDQVIAQSGSGTRAARDAAFVSGAFTRLQKTRPSVTNSPIAPLGDVTHHYHVMLETLPRMLHARAMNPDVSFVTSSVVPSRYQALFDDLQLVVKECPPGEVLVGNPLVLVDQPDLFWPRKADLMVLRSALGQKSSSPRRFLYLPRGESFRETKNEVTLSTELGQKGFDLVHMEDLSIAEQWQIASEARCIVGLHGAALTAVAAMQPETSLIEISSGEHFEGCYRRIAELDSKSYSFVRLAGSESKPFGDAAHLAQEILALVDPAELLP